MIEWIVGLIPWWAWVGAVVVAALFIYRALGWQGLVGLAFAAVALVSHNAGRRQALERERRKQEQERARAQQARKEVDDEIENLGAADVDHRLARWLRDGDR